MKPTLPILLLALLSFFLVEDSKATTTYTINSNTSWTTLIGYGCTNCIFNIAAGATLTLDQNYASCGTCTFTGGTVNITTNFSFYTGVSFSGGTLLMNGPATFQATSFGSDTIAINQPATFYTGTTFTNARMSINAATTCQACSFTNDSIHMANQALTLQSSTNNFTNTNFAITGTSSISSTAGLSLTNSNFSFSASSYLNNNGGTFTASSSTLSFNDSSHFQSSSAAVIKNNSEILIGDGTLASKAYMFYNAGTALNIYDNSMIKVANGNNSYQNGNPYKYTNASNATTSYNTSSNSISCNPAPAVHTYANSCTANYVYGCATLNSAGALGCTTLAITDLDLSLTVTGKYTVALTWSDVNNKDADRFQVQRSTNGQDWVTIGTEVASGYSTGEYYFNDAAASAGTDYYRLLRTDKDGAVLYSKVITAMIDTTPATISIYPNPVTGHTFTIKTGTADAVLVNIFNLSGQLLFRTSLKGQTQYPVNLPASITPGNYMVVQVISNEGTQAFNILNQ